MTEKVSETDKISIPNNTSRAATSPQRTCDCTNSVHCLGSSPAASSAIAVSRIDTRRAAGDCATVSACRSTTLKMSSVEAPMSAVGACDCEDAAAAGAGETEDDVDDADDSVADGNDDDDAEETVEIAEEAAAAAVWRARVIATQFETAPR